LNLILTTTAFMTVYYVKSNLLVVKGFITKNEKREKMIYLYTYLRLTEISYKYQNKFYILR